MRPSQVRKSGFVVDPTLRDKGTTIVAVGLVTVFLSPLHRKRFVFRVPGRLLQIDHLFAPIQRLNP